MATRTEPTEASKAAAAALEALEGSFQDTELREFRIETSRGPVSVYSGPVSLKVLDEVQRLLGGDDVPLENMVDVLILLARTETGAPMFRKVHRDRLLNGVDPMFIVKAAEFLGEAATASLTEAQEEAGKD